MNQIRNQGSTVRCFGVAVFAGVFLATASVQAASPTIYSLNGGSEGKTIYGRVVEGEAGTFYGITQQGGANGSGAIFKVTSAGVYTRLYSFGTAADDGAFPGFGGLLKAHDGNFYGTTQSGGTGGNGTLFKITPAGVFTVLYPFGSQANDPAGTKSTLMQAGDGALYGTSFQGGANNTGTIFKVVTNGTAAGTTVSVLHPFTSAAGGTNADGALPQASLVQASDGFLYGTTGFGGSSGNGTIFKIDGAGNFTALSSGVLNGNRGGLIQASDGNFYGLGSTNSGVVCKIVTNGTPGGTTVTVIYSFQSSPDGAAPDDKLLEGSDGNFYGTTELGGLGSGTVFRITPGGTETVVYSFGANSGDGGNPFAELIQGSDGNFYGTTKAGGGANAGTVFKIAGPPPPAPPPHGGLSSTTFTVNGSQSPSANLADTVLRFRALQGGTPGGLKMRVQATTTPNTEASWADLANDRHGRMTFDSNRNQFFLNSTDYPAQNGVYFRAIGSASNYPDSISNVVGPFNLTGAKAHLAPTRFAMFTNSSIADLYFRATKSSVQNGEALRIQSSTNPTDEASWTDLNNGNAGAMQRSTNPAFPNVFLLLVNNYPAAQGVFFRAVASLSGAVDSISNATGPFTLVNDTPPSVTVQPPAGLAGSGDGHDAAHPVIVSVGQMHIVVNAQSNRTIKTLKLLVDGSPLVSLNDTTNIDYTTSVIGVGLHVLEGFAIDDLGAAARGGTGAVYLQVNPPTTNAVHAQRMQPDGATATTAAGKTFKAVQNNFWRNAPTWKDENGNTGIPGPNDYAIVGTAIIGLAQGDDITVNSVSISGGKLLGTAVTSTLTVTGTMTITAGSVDGAINLIIREGAKLDLINPANISFNGANGGVGSVYNHGTINLHGAAGIRGMDIVDNFALVNFQTPISPALNAAVDPAAANRVVNAQSIEHLGKITGTGGALITSDGAGLITSDGAGLLTNNGGTIVSRDGAGLIGNSGSTLLGQDGASLIGNDGSTLLASDGATLLASDGATFISDQGSASAASRPPMGPEAATAAPGFVQTGGETDLSHVWILGTAAINGGTVTGSGIVVGDLTNNSFIAPGHSAGGISIFGNYTQGAQGTLVIENGGAKPGQYDRIDVLKTATLNGKLDVRDINGYTPDTLDTFTPLGCNASSGNFSSVSGNAQVVVSAKGALVSVNPNAPAPKAGQPLNISTRMNVLAGDNALIAGFIVTGPNGSTKKVLIRGIGPSLANFGVSGTLSDPFLELHKPDGSVVSNDNWQQGDTSRIPNGFAPGDSRESVIVATLAPGNYSAVLKGAHGETGVGIAEAYDLDSSSAAQLANISTRGFVNTGDNVMIGGFIVGGSEPAKVLVRAIGPSLTAFGVQGALPATTLELHDANGAAISNEGWRNTQEADIKATTIPPSNDNEAAILATLVPGNYTAVVRGKNNATGIGLVEAYNLP